MFPFHDDNPTSRFPYMTVALVAINAVSFWYLLQLDPLQRQLLVAERGFVPMRLAQFVDRDVEVEVPISTEVVGRPVRVGNQIVLQPVQVQRTHKLAPSRTRILSSLVTCMFLHGGWMHLIGNMWFLWLFGNNVEDKLGHAPYVVFFFVGGILASLVHAAVTPAQGMTTPVIGASGAVAAVLGAYFVRFPHANIRTLVVIVIFITIIDLPAWVVLGVWFLAQLWDGVKDLNVFSGGVAFWAHIGGFVVGAALMPLLRRLFERPVARTRIVVERDDELW